MRNDPVVSRANIITLARLASTPMHDESGRSSTADSHRGPSPGGMRASHDACARPSRDTSGIAEPTGDTNPVTPSLGAFLVSVTETSDEQHAPIYRKAAKRPGLRTTRRQSRQVQPQMPRVPGYLDPGGPADRKPQAIFSTNMVASRATSQRINAEPRSP
jgi:hypothetical protein